MNIRFFYFATMVALLSTPALTSLCASQAALEGTVRDSQLNPVKNAIVRIEAKNGQFSNSVKTDAKGHYWCENLEAGAYRVTLVVDGMVKASINNAKAISGESRRLDFDLTGRYGAKAKHLVYLPIEKFSNLGGHWVDVDDRGHPNNVTTDNIETLSHFNPSDTTGSNTDHTFMHVNAPNYEH